MENVMMGSRVSLGQTEYHKIHTLKTGDRSVVVLQDNAGRRYVLKLVKAHSRNADKWREAYRISYEKLSGDVLVEPRRRRNVCVPQMLAVYDDIRTDNGRACGLLMEFIEGRMLSAVLPKVSTAELLNILISVANTVRYVDQKLEYYHMDIAPHNIIIDSRSSAWLIDFEGAYLLGEGHRLMVRSTLTSAAAEQPGALRARDCEAEQCRMIMSLLENRLDAAQIATLCRRWQTAADSPLIQLRIELKKLRTTLL